jgi:hypothetical protein
LVADGFDDYSVCAHQLTTFDQSIGLEVLFVELHQSRSRSTAISIIYHFDAVRRNAATCNV